jgi:catechol-2,3-dioxygenase
MFQIEGLDHIALTVSDMNRSEAWYCEVLGLVRCHREWEIPVVLCAGVTGVALFPAAIEPPRAAPPARETLIMRHYAFRVTRPNFDTARASLSANNIAFEFEDHTVSHSIYLTDPDGYRVELTTYEIEAG